MYICCMCLYNNDNNNTDFKCLFLGKFKDTGKKFTMKIN